MAFTVVDITPIGMTPFRLSFIPYLLETSFFNEYLRYGWWVSEETACLPCSLPGL
jgi:hypothetical protein